MHAAAYVGAQTLAGITPNDGVAVFERVAGAAVVGEPAVNLIHPTGLVAAIELIKVIDALHILAIVHGRPGILQLDTRLGAGALEDIEHGFPLLKSDL